MSSTTPLSTRELNPCQLFFLDSAPSAKAPKLSLIPGHPSDDNDDQAGGKDGPAWVDSDDERITISLASQSRLRKLRITESEDLINGREYTKRLRRQFERLYPVPDWANPSTPVKPKKRRKSNEGDVSSGDASADDMSIDSDDLSVQPLAKLLQNATDIVKTTSASSSGRKKLRPEVIDVQRTKDVGLAQPVSTHPGDSASYTQLTSPARQKVLHNVPDLSPSPPSPPLFRSCLHSLPPPHIPAPSQPEPAFNLPPPTLHPSLHLHLPPPRWRQNFLLRPSSLLSHLGPLERKNRQGHPCLRPWQRAANHGALQALPLRAVDGPRGLRTQRRRDGECSGCAHLSVGCGSAGRR